MENVDYLLLPPLPLLLCSIFIFSISPLFTLPSAEYFLKYSPGYINPLPYGIRPAGAVHNMAQGPASHPCEYDISESEEDSGGPITLLSCLVVSCMHRAVKRLSGLSALIGLNQW